MKQVFFVLVAIFLVFSPSINAFSQSKPAKVDNTPQKAWIIFANWGLAVPASDMAVRFGTANEAGAGVWYKTRNNWFMGIEAHYFFSDQVKENDILDNFINSDGNLIGNNGFKAEYRIQQRGSKLPQVRFGKVIPVGIGKAAYGSGVMLSISGGAFMHRIKIVDDSRSIAQIAKEYAKGYDRFSLGPMTSQQIGYIYQHKNKRINFYMALEHTLAFTKNRRELNFDTGLRDDRLRIDRQWLLKAGWFFPIYENKPDDFYYF